MKATITFDESGNTGGTGLLNEDQPVFVLASCNFSMNEAETLLRDHVYTHQTNEAKFANLRKTASGRKRIIEFLRAVIQSPFAFKVMIYHKRFMVASKIIDILVEELARRDGMDLYKSGANIAMTNVLFYCTPVYCGTDRTIAMYRSFIGMVQKQDDASISKFYFDAWQVFSASISEKFQSTLAPILATEPHIKDILTGLNSNSLDPAIPCFFSLCDAWGREINDYFDIQHDASKPIFQEKEVLEACMSKDIPRSLIGYDSRKIDFPLRANGIVFADSKNDYRLQVADLLAGSFAFWAKGLATNCADDNLWDELNALNFDEFAGRSVWPADPKNMSSLEGFIDDGTGVNAVDFMAKHINLTG